MAWLRSCQELEGHPKLIKLIALTGWEKDAAIGRLHRFWWWVQKYAETGSLAPFKWQEIDAAMNFTPGTNFLKSMVKSGFVDAHPNMRVHDWWDHNGPWLMTRFKHYPDKWESVKRCYKSENGVNRSLKRSKNVLRTVDVTDVTDVKKEPLTPQSGDLATPSIQKQTSRATGINPRAKGTNPRALAKKALNTMEREKMEKLHNVPDESQLPTDEDLATAREMAGLPPLIKT